MALLSGFWNSVNGDRLYSAEDMAIPFDGVITDGVFANWGEAFRVHPSSDGKSILVEPGKVWCKKRWAYLDATQTIALPNADSQATQYVIVYIDFKTEATNRYAQITTITVEEPYSQAAAIKNAWNAFPLAFINQGPAQTGFQIADVVNLVGTQYCPYVAAPVTQFSVDDIRARYDHQLNELSSSYLSQIQSKASIFEQAFETRMTQWFATLQATLDGNAAAKLASELAKTNAKFEMLAATGEVEIDIEILATFPGGITRLEKLTDNSNTNLTGHLKFNTKG